MTTRMSNDRLAVAIRGGLKHRTKMSCSARSVTRILTRFPGAPAFWLDVDEYGGTNLYDIMPWSLPDMYTELANSVILCCKAHEA